MQAGSLRSRERKPGIFRAVECGSDNVYCFFGPQRMSFVYNTVEGLQVEEPRSPALLSFASSARGNGRRQAPRWRYRLRAAKVSMWSARRPVAVGAPAWWNGSRRVSVVRKLGEQVEYVAEVVRYLPTRGLRGPALRLSPFLTTVDLTSPALHGWSTSSAAPR
jgi:hypothetical protein